MCHVFSLSLLFVLFGCCSVVARDNSRKASVIKKYSLHHNNVLIDVPTDMVVDSEYYHFWDGCPNGGYSVAFKGHNNSESGMNMQINVHDHIDGEPMLSTVYNPHMHAPDNKRAVAISDTTFYNNGNQYRVITTLAKPGRRKSAKTHNYHFSYYVITAGRMLELHYNSWDKSGKNVERWQDMSCQIAASVYLKDSSWNATALK